MRSTVKPHYARRTMFDTAFPLEYKGRTFPRYFTYSKRFTLKYLRCLVFGHTGISYTDISVSPGRIDTIVPARCCNRTYYPEEETTHGN